MNEEVLAPRTPEEITADATVALGAIDTEITRLRNEKLHISGLIAKLLNQRKPLVRIVGAAHGRKPKAQASDE